MQSNPKILLVIKILSIFGMVLALYLFYNYVAKPDSQLCTINSTINCHAVTVGELKDFLGVPVPIIGLVGYFLIFAFTHKNNLKWAFGTALFGMIFCLRLTILEIFVLKVLCPVCLLCQLDMLVVTILLAISLMKSKS